MAPLGPRRCGAPRPWPPYRAGPIPVDMIGAGERMGDTTPPSIAVPAFAAAQAGLLLAASPPVTRPRPWRRVARLNPTVMRPSSGRSRCSHRALPSLMPLRTRSCSLWTAAVVAAFTEWCSAPSARHCSSTQSAPSPSSTRTDTSAPGLPPYPPGMPLAAGRDGRVAQAASEGDLRVLRDGQNPAKLVLDVLVAEDADHLHPDPARLSREPHVLQVAPQGHQPEHVPIGGGSTLARVADDDQYNGQERVVASRNPCSRSVTSTGPESGAHSVRREHRRRKGGALAMSSSSLNGS